MKLKEMEANDALQVDPNYEHEFIAGAGEEDRSNALAHIVIAPELSHVMKEPTNMLNLAQSYTVEPACGKLMMLSDDVQANAFPAIDPQTMKSSFSTSGTVHEPINPPLIGARAHSRSTKRGSSLPSSRTYPSKQVTVVLSTPEILLIGNLAGLTCNF